MCTIISAVKCTFTCILVNGDCVRKADGYGSIAILLIYKSNIC